MSGDEAKFKLLKLFYISTLQTIAFIDLLCTSLNHLSWLWLIFLTHWNLLGFLCINIFPFNLIRHTNHKKAWRFDAHFQSINPAVVHEKDPSFRFPSNCHQINESTRDVREGGEGNFRLSGTMVQNLAQFLVNLTKTLPLNK